jgi:hypothetical protein
MLRVSWPTSIETEYPRRKGFVSSHQFSKLRNSETSSQERLKHVAKLDSAATSRRRFGNCSKLFSAGNHFDFLLLAAGNPGAN